MNVLYAGIFLGSIICGSSWAKFHSSDFIEFQAPDTWTCVKDGQNLKCDILDSQQLPAGTLESAARLYEHSGDKEFAKIVETFSKPMEFTLPSGQVVQSNPIYSRKIDVVGKTWIDTLHHAGHKPNSFTRHLAAADSNISMVITFTIEREKYESVKPQIDLFIQHLRLFRAQPVCYGVPENSSEETKSSLFEESQNLESGSGSKKWAAIAIGLVGLAIAGILSFVLNSKRTFFKRPK